MTQLQFSFMVGVHDAERPVPNWLKIAKGQLELLETMIAKPDRVATLDDATKDLLEAFEDGGKWRGAITLDLSFQGVISQCGAENSKRPSRNRGLLRKWRLDNERMALRLIESLRRRIEAIENPPTAGTVGGLDGSKTKQPNGKDS